MAEVKTEINTEIKAVIITEIITGIKHTATVSYRGFKVLILKMSLKKGVKNIVNRSNRRKR